MKSTYLYIINLILILALITACPQINLGDEDQNSNKKTTDEVLLYNNETGFVSGTVNDAATVTVNQSDGTTQSAETTKDNPDFVFENVPTGNTTITIDNGTTTTTQEIYVEANEVTQINPFGSTQEMAESFTVNVYEVENKGWNTKITDILTDNQLGESFYAKEINIPTRSFNEGFPGVTDKYEWFGIIYNGQIKAPVDGTYTFKLTCDDGAKLYINDETIVNGDGVHSSKSYKGTVDLSAGEIYDIEIRYFQGPRYHICLVAEVEIPGEDMKLFNLNDFAE